MRRMQKVGAHRQNLLMKTVERPQGGRQHRKMAWARSGGDRLNQGPEGDIWLELLNKKHLFFVLQFCH